MGRDVPIRGVLFIESDWNKVGFITQTIHCTCLENGSRLSVKGLFFLNRKNKKKVKDNTMKEKMVMGMDFEKQTRDY